MMVHTMSETEHAPAVAEPVPPTFEQLYHDRFKEMSRLATVMGAGPQGAFDITQDAFIALYRHWDKVDNPLAYVRRCIVNSCHSSSRRRGRGERAMARAANGADTTVHLASNELADVLAKLPERQRAAIVLRHYLGLRDADIAEVLGCAPGTVASLVHRGLATMKEVLPS